MPSKKVELSTGVTEFNDVVQELRDLTSGYLKSLEGPKNVKIVEQDDDDSDLEDEYRLEPRKPKKVTPPKRDYSDLRTGVLEKLLEILDSKDPKTLPIEKVNQFYKYLNGPNDLLPDDSRKNWDSNLDIIKEDKSKSALRFVAGISIIALTILTAFAPGLIIMGIVYACTHRHVFDLFKPKADQFEKEVQLVQNRHMKFYKKAVIDDDTPLPTIDFKKNN